MILWRGSGRHTSHGRTKPSINNRLKLIRKGKRKSRRSRISSELVAGLREIFGKDKTVDQGNKLAVEDDLHRCMEILNELDVSPDLYNNVVTLYSGAIGTHRFHVDSKIRC